MKLIIGVKREKVLFISKAKKIKKLKLMFHIKFIFFLYILFILIKPNITFNKKKIFSYLNEITI